MSLPAGIHAQIILGGAIGVERWSVGYWLRYDSSVSLPTPAEANTYALAILNQFNTLVWSGATASVKAQNSTDTTLDTCTVRFYDGNTLMVDGLATITPVAGTGGGAHPGYVACCVSLLTPFPGRSKRGRMYLPATAMPVNGTTSLWLTNATVDAFAVNLAGYFANSVHVPSWGSPASFTVVIMSKLLGSTSDVVNIRIDNIPDTQHGRTKKLVSSHTAVHSVP